MTARPPAPGDATREPAGKPRAVPWTSLVAIVILCALAAAVLIPSYGDYTHRSQMSEAVNLLSSAKTPLAEYFANHNKWPASLGEVVGALSGKHVQSAAITKGAGGTGELEMTAVMKTEGVDRRVAGMSVRLLSPDGGKSWLCRPGTAPEKVLPGSCRVSPQSR